MASRLLKALFNFSAENNLLTSSILGLCCMKGVESSDTVCSCVLRWFDDPSVLSLTKEGEYDIYTYACKALVLFQEFVKTSSRQLDAIKGRKKDYVDGSGEEGKELREMTT